MNTVLNITSSNYFLSNNFPSRHFQSQNSLFNYFCPAYSSEWLQACFSESLTSMIHSQIHTIPTLSRGSYHKGSPPLPTIRYWLCLRLSITAGMSYACSQWCSPACSWRKMMGFKGLSCQRGRSIWNCPDCPFYRVPGFLINILLSFQ